MDRAAEGATSQEGTVEGAADAPAESSKISQKIAGCWKTRESLWVGLIVLLLGVIGQILLYLIPSEDFATNSTYADYQLIGSLRVCAEAATSLGAITVGVFLARWGLRKAKA